MKHRIIPIVGSAAVITVLALTGCAGVDPSDARSGAADAGSTSSAAPSPTTSVSDIDAAVQTFVTALDDLGIQHGDPTRTEVGLSGAKARFDITVDGFDAGINVFPDADALATWGQASDSLGGIYVASGNAVLSLSSSDGAQDSATIAPKIAAAVHGQAHGV